MFFCNWDRSQFNSLRYDLKKSIVLFSLTKNGRIADEGRPVAWVCDLGHKLEYTKSLNLRSIKENFLLEKLIEKVIEKFATAQQSFLVKQQ